MNFVIHKHIGPTHSHGLWSIEQRHVYCGPLYWVEMLAAVAKELLDARWPPYAWEEKGGIPFAPLYSVVVNRARDNHYSIRCGSKFLDGLCSDEALGFIAAYTLTDGEKQFFGGLKSYAQWAGSPWNNHRKIAGLITYQPEHVA